MDFFNVDGCIGVKKINTIKKLRRSHCSIAMKQGGWGLLDGWFLGLYGPMDQSIYNILVLSRITINPMRWYRQTLVIVKQWNWVVSSFLDGSRWFLQSWRYLNLRRWTHVLSALEAPDQPNLEIKTLFRSSDLLRPRPSTTLGYRCLSERLKPQKSMPSILWQTLFQIKKNVHLLLVGAEKLLLILLSN